MPHKDRVDGTVRSTKPLSYGGTLIEDFSLRFAEGRVVDVTGGTRRGGAAAARRRPMPARRGSARWRSCRTTRRSRSPGCCSTTRCSTRTRRATSRSASAYKFTLRGGEAMSDEEFEQAGGNRSATHVDFMIGSAELDVDGVLPDGGDRAADAPRRVGPRWCCYRPMTSVSVRPR